MNIICTICSDLVNQAENIYVTKCGHVFHHHCLTQWIQRSMSCPQCRNTVTERCMFRLYPTVSNETSAQNAATLQSQLDDAQLQLRQQRAACQTKDDKINSLQADFKDKIDLIKSYEKKLISRDSAVDALKQQSEYMKIQLKETNRLKAENEHLQKIVHTLNGLEKVLNATSDDVEKIVQNYSDVKTVALFATSLKRALCDSEAKKNEFRDKLHLAKQQLTAEQNLKAELLTELLDVQEKLRKVTQEMLGYKRTFNSSNKSQKEETPPKRQKRGKRDLNTAMVGENDSSMNSTVDSITTSDSPYLDLKETIVGLSARNTNLIPDYSIKPSEFSIVNAARAHALKSSGNALSIFHKKQPMKSDTCEVPTFDVTYDGLGGHSKLDTFPTPKPRPTFKSCVPKLTAKHKLKRPAGPSGNQDIGKLLEKMSQDSDS